MRKRPSKQSVRQFGLYNIGGLAFFIVGYTVFVLLYGILSWKWWVAKIFADLTGWSVNYLVQRFVAFRHESKHHSERAMLKRFSAISLVNVPIDYALVGGLKMLGVSPFLGLWLSSLFFTVWKFVWYKRWVFRVPPKT
jgi:putative flippase GtrA